MNTRPHYESNHEAHHHQCSRLPGFFTALLVIFLPAPLSAEWFYDASADVTYNDNLSNAPWSRDIEDDTSVEGELSLGYYRQETDYVSVSVAAVLQGVRQMDFTGLDHVSAGISASLRGKAGLGADAPWVKMSGTVMRDEYRNDPRDGWYYNLSVAAGKRFGNRWDTHLVFACEQSQADQVVDVPFLVTNFGIHGDAFSTHSCSLTAGGVFTMTDRLALLFDYTRRRGTVTSTTSPDLEILEYSDAATLDTAFGANRVAYRVDADTDIFSAGLSWALGDRASLNANFIRRDSQVNEDISYGNNIFSIGILYAY